jgi:hypothetical protein
MFFTFEKIGHAVTILNRAAARDIGATSDAWKSTVLQNVQWDTKKSGVQIDTKRNSYFEYILQIPHTENFVSYREFAQMYTATNAWTLSINDYAILGTIEETPTAENIADIVAKYAPNVCQIMSIEDKRANGAIESSRIGTLLWLTPLVVRGV